jgi:hypothetical protein
VSAVVFGQHVHWMLILVIFSSGVVWRAVYNSNPQREKLKERFLLGNCKYSYRTASKGKSEPLPPARGMSTCRGQHFQHHLWSVNCNYFIPNITGQQAYWFIGKICMRLTASSEQVNKGKNVPVELTACPETQ